MYGANLMNILNMLWVFLNSPAGLMVLGALLTWIAAKVYAAKPEWKKFEGDIISAVKAAERAIPDGLENKGMLRLDAALQLVIRAWEKEHSGKSPSAAVEKSLKQGVQIVHEQLEKDGVL